MKDRHSGIVQQTKRVMEIKCFRIYARISSLSRRNLLFCLIGLMLVVYLLSLFHRNIASPYVREWSFSKYIVSETIKTIKADNLSAHVQKLILGSDNERTYEARAAKKYYVVIDWTGYNWRNKGDFVVDDNCLITRNKNQLNVSSAVVVTIRHQSRIEDLPRVRFEWQRWVWLNDERPFHTLRPGNMHNFKVKDLAGMFNWTMTHRLDSDVPIPYGYTTRNDSAVLYNAPIIDMVKRHLVAGMISNCNGGTVHNGRLRYIRQLNETVDVHLYGMCGSYTCPGYQGMLPWQPCAELKNYLFFLSFENSNCRDYITEKLFMNALSVGAVPVVMGANRTSYELLAPPNSFIHVSDFHSPEELGKYLVLLQDNLTEYMTYHSWRGQHTINYRLQYLDNKIWLPLCLALKTDDGKTKIYKDINDWWSVQRDCEPHVTEN